MSLLEIVEDNKAKAQISASEAHVIALWKIYDDARAKGTVSEWTTAKARWEDAVEKLNGLKAKLR